MQQVQGSVAPKSVYFSCEKEGHISFVTVVSGTARYVTEAMIYDACFAHDCKRNAFQILERKPELALADTYPNICSVFK